MPNFDRRLAALVGVVAVALVAGLVLVFWPGGDKRTVVADFPRTVSLYEGSDVKILGVKVGTVDKVQPAGTTVRVTMTYDAKYPVPNDAKAVLISPAIVGDRFVQLTPAYKGGARLADNAHLGPQRTAVPVELDQIYASLNQLSIALGPDEANKADASGEGPLTRLLQSTASNVGGQGAQLNRTITNVSRLTQTLDDNKDDLFGSMAEIEKFVKTLADNDTTVRQFNDSLSRASDLLAGERGDLAAALKNLSVALVNVRGFISGNRQALSTNIAGLAKVTQTLVKRRDQLDEILRVAPGALNNLALAYNPQAGTLDQRTNLTESLKTDPRTLICGLVAQAGQDATQCNKVLGGLGLGSIGLPRAAALPLKTTADDPGRYVDRSLAGLVEVGR